MAVYVSCSEWLHLWCFDSAVLVGLVGVVAATCTNDQVGLLVDVGVVRVEVLPVVVVEYAWAPVVLHQDLDEGSHFLCVVLLVLVLLVTLGSQSGVVVDSLELGLALVLLVLETEVVYGLVSGLVTPVGLEALCLLLLEILVAAEIVVAVGATATEEVPVSATVDGRGGNETPEDPSALADHPHVGLPHIVRDVKHHYY